MIYWRQILLSSVIQVFTENQHLRHGPSVKICANFVVLLAVYGCNRDNAKQMFCGQDILVSGSNDHLHPRHLQVNNPDFFALIKLPDSIQIKFEDVCVIEQSRCQMACVEVELLVLVLFYFAETLAIVI